MIFFNNAVGFGVSKNVVAEEIQNLLFPLFIRRYVIPVIGRWLPFTVMRVHDSLGNTAVIFAKIDQIIGHQFLVTGFRISP